jgi:NADH:ubiquinone oxidoreductase subunit C
MIEREYLTVNSIAKTNEMTARNVRKIINKIKHRKSKDLLYKDKLDQWQVHHLLLPEFKRKRNKIEKHYALTIDPCCDYSNKDIDEIMQFVFTQTGDESLEINYTIEKKKANNQNHIHCYIKSTQKRKLLQSVKLAFTKTNYYENDIYDLEGWKRYITKDGNPINTIKN